MSERTSRSLEAQAAAFAQILAATDDTDVAFRKPLRSPMACSRIR